MKAFIEGGEPLIGTVSLSGSWKLGMKLIAASLFSNEQSVILNVPKIGIITEYLTTLNAIGIKTTFSDQNKLIIDASSITSSEIPADPALSFRAILLLAGPLLYRFGKVSIPKSSSIPVNRWLSTWKNLGIEIEEDVHYYHLKVNKLQGANISFSSNSVTGTENAILSSVFVPGETIIDNAAAEPEVNDLISYLVSMGANINRVAPRRIIVNGVNTFSGSKFELSPNIDEAVFFVCCALATYGDLVIEDLSSSNFLSFVRKLENLGADYDFRGDSLRVWRRGGKELNAVEVETSAYPGFLTDWLPAFIVLLTQATGNSRVYDTVYTDRLGFTRELNRAGAGIQLYTPSEVGLEMITSDDAYDFSKYGEPHTVAKISGPTLLRKSKFDISNLIFSYPLLLTALIAAGKSELHSVEALDNISEGMFEKLKKLGAKIELEN